MAGDCCTASNLPLWPLYYQRHDEDGVEEPDKGLKRGWYPFIVNYCRYTAASTLSAWCVSILVILLRIVSLPGGWALSVLWPIFNISKRAKEGEGWIFTLRLLPLVYVYISQRRVLVAIAPCIIFYKSREQGGEGRTVLHIFPLLSVVSTTKQGKRSFFLSVLYVFYYRTIHTPLLGNANAFNTYRAIVIFPVFWYFREGKSTVTTICGVIWILTYSSGFLFCIFPFVWVIKGTSDFTIFCFVFYLRTAGGRLKKLFLLPFFTFYRDGSEMVMSVCLLYWLRVATNHNGQREVLTTLIPFFFFYRDPAIDKTGFGLFYIVWFVKNPANSSVTMAVLPFFYYRSPSWTRIVGFLLFWMAKHSSGMWWATVFPIFFIKRNGNSVRCWLFPIFYYSSSGKDNYTLGVLFVFWVSHSPNDTLVLLLPFGFIHRSGDSVTSLILVFLYSKKVLGVLPFFTISRSTSSTTVSLFMLIWLYTDNDSFVFTFFPFVWVTSSSNAFGFYLVPLFWFHRSRAELFLLLFPFFLCYTGNTFAHVSVFPLFHVSHTQDNAFYSLLYLFWWWRYNSKWSVCCIDAFWLN